MASSAGAADRAWRVSGKRLPYTLDRGGCLGGYPQALFAYYGVAQVRIGNGKLFAHGQMIPVTHTNMNISVTEFKQHCLEIIRQVEKTGRPVAITRRGKVVVRLTPSWPAGHGGLKPWEQLRALGGRLLAEPGESVLHDEDFEALR